MPRKKGIRGDWLLEHDLLNQDYDRRITRGQVKLGRSDAVRRTFNLLETRFEAVDMEGDASTRARVKALIRRDRRVATGRRDDTRRSRLPVWSSFRIRGYRPFDRLCRLGDLSGFEVGSGVAT